MKMTFRWYGESDPVTLEKIRQIPAVSGIVSAVYTKKVGEVWDQEEIDNIKASANKNGLEFEVVESVPVHEDIKLWKSTAPKLCENYCENIRRLAKAGVKCICYNFMPVFDWLRSELEKPQLDGSTSLSYDEKTVLKLNPLTSELSLPGWDESYTKAELTQLLQQYTQVSEEKLWHNFTNFLNAVIPTAEECGVKLAIHPDDPPWGIFGLPRIITCEESYKKMLEAVPSSSNCFTFCTGSLGADPGNNLAQMAAKYAKNIAFAHFRNIKHTGYRCFEETAHLSKSGSLDMYKILKSLLDNGFDGYIRPDHGRMIWGEKGRAGYGLYDRALGAMYLYGLYEAITKESQKENN